MLSPIIRNIKLVVENNQDLADRRVRPPTVEEQVDVISDGRRGFEKNRTICVSLMNLKRS